MSEKPNNTAGHKIPMIYYPKESRFAHSSKYL